MRKSFAIFACAACAGAFSFGAMARGPGGAGGSGFSHGSAVGPSSNHALQNSNGRFSTDRETGLDRARERMSEQGLEHEKATDAQKKRSQRRDHK